MKRLPHLLARLAALPLCTLPAAASEPSPRSAWLPDGGFVQAGVAETARTLTIGATWAWSWRRPWAGGQLGGYWEASFGRWASDLEDGRGSTAWVTQLGVTPALRWSPDGARWFLEGGIGANLLLPIYRSKDKRFSTRFNFGDHLAVGWRLGQRHEHELALRIQHYSNAGIRRPNPGEDFLQLRYTRSL
ncbi:acyloxyacyl hydrolase [Rubrivivax sp. RP6-9]|uniref:acyloxyacyl hydrolase n=1 Tax=Rubrivivax sp. RP6-9 TaxID=3415750 RepID=UPI003CC59C4E